VTLVAAGHYRAVAVLTTTPDGETFAQFGETKNGNPQVVVNFEILDGPEAGRRIAWFGYFTEKTAQRTVESLRYCGFKGNDLSAAVTQPLDQEVQIVIDHEEYNGKTSAKVQWVNRGGGDGFRLEKPMDRRGLERFAAQMKASVMQIPDAPGKKGERGAKAPPAEDQGDVPPAGWDQQSRSSAPPVKDDDDGIPF
jgi:hypothetical protein